TSVLEVIKNNISTYINSNANVKVIKSDIFDNQVFNNKKFDLIYENLPNIPISLIDQELDQDINSSSYIADASINNNYFSKYLLDLHYRFLKQCKTYMNISSSAICNIGVRFPLRVYEKLFEQFSYKHEVLVAGLKIQTEARDVIKGYLNAERQFNEQQFYYYSVEEMPKDLLNQRLIKPDKTELLNFLSKVKHFQIDMHDAYSAVLNNRNVAHLVFTTGIYNFG
ncbi:hypothetical protein, partial [Bombilactobacillus bombi]|uniref:hypothetical protein n=1 Tax=Bombilactobacillus bombi TaxID=1303590 RepID=UPI001C63481A